MWKFSDLIPSIALLILAGGGHFLHALPLDCFTCDGISKIDDCHTTGVCLEGEHCYAETYLNKTGHLVYTLGCREKEFCLGLDQQFGKKRRASATPGCLQCCTLHGCNKYLCPVRFQSPSKPGVIGIVRLPAYNPVNGVWSVWGPWSTCGVSCGIGLRSRYRACNNPPPSQNGQLCLGDAKDVKICQISCSTATVPVTTSKPTPTPPTRSTTTSAPPSPTPTTTVKPATTAPTTTPNATQPPFVTHDLTQKPGDCKDLIECSGYFRPDACVGVYSAWAHRYCPDHCGYCPTASPKPCVDTVTNCHEYQDDLCTNSAFWQWRESHCAKYCKLC